MDDPVVVVKPLPEFLFPDRDANFSKIVQHLSKPESGPAADNLMTNEDSFTRVSAEIEHRAPKNSLYLGVGPDQNFSLIAHAQPTLALIIDYRRRNQLLHLLHKALFALSNDRRDYLSRLTARSIEGKTSDLALQFAAVPMDRGKLDTSIAEVATYLRSFQFLTVEDLETIATIQARLAGPGVNYRFLALRMYPTLSKLMSMPGHLLSVEAIYQRVRDLQRADRIIPIVGDWGGPGGFPRLGAWLRDHSLKVGTIYISDVEYFLIRAGRLAAYAESLHQLPSHPDAIIVRTSTREIDHPERLAGDSSTTIVRPLARFLAQSRLGRIQRVDDLFRPQGG